MSSLRGHDSELAENMSSFFAYPFLPKSYIHKIKRAEWNKFGRGSIGFHSLCKAKRGPKVNIKVGVFKNLLEKHRGVEKPSNREKRYSCKI